MDAHKKGRATNQSNTGEHNSEIIAAIVEQSMDSALLAIHRADSIGYAAAIERLAPAYEVGSSDVREFLECLIDWLDAAPTYSDPSGEIIHLRNLTFGTMARYGWFGAAE